MEVLNTERRQALKRANHAPSRRLAFVRDQLRTLSLAIVLFAVVRSFLVEAYKIPTGSMEGTLLPGDFLLVNKLVYGAELPLVGGRTPRIRAPQRGDVIVFRSPKDPSTNFVKRVVGVAGDTLAMKKGALFVNGTRQRESYARHVPLADRLENEFDWQVQYLAQAVGSYRPSRDNWGPLIVPRAHYFVLGDNRENSFDSRYWGFVPDSLVRGQPVVVYYSFNPDGSPRGSWVSRVRWRRVGSVVE